MATQLKPVDVAVIGLGAAGGVAVLPLARAGLKVAGIEAGTWMGPRDYRADEIHNNVRRLVTSVPKAQREIPTARTNPSETARQAAAQHPMMNAVGGTSIHYWAQSWRLKPWDFKTRSESIRRYGSGSIPQGSTLEDWPITYDELEPYYDTIEWEVGVSGKAGNIQGKIDPRGNIFEGPRRREYPMPPLRSTEFIDHMSDAAKRLGWHPFHPPAAINTAALPRPPRVRLPRLLRHRRMSRQRQELHRGHHHSRGAQDQESDDLRSRARDTDRYGRERTRHRRNLHPKRKRVFPARESRPAGWIYLRKLRACCCFRSRASHPNGLSNSHGQVGKHFFAHYQTAVTALFPFDVNIWYGLPAQGITVDDFADDAYDHTGLGFIGGTSLHVRTERHAIEGAEMDTYGKAPRWGSAWKKFVHENAARVAKTYLQTSTFPYETCYLDLDPEVRDPLRRSGLPDHHRRSQTERSERGPLRPAENGAMVPRGGRHRGGSRRSRRARAYHARLRRHPHGRQSRKRTWSTAGAFRTKLPTWASWALR